MSVKCLGLRVPSPKGKREPGPVAGLDRSHLTGMPHASHGLSLLSTLVREQIDTTQVTVKITLIPQLAAIKGMVS